MQKIIFWSLLLLLDFSGWFLLLLDEITKLNLWVCFCIFFSPLESCLRILQIDLVTLIHLPNMFAVIYVADWSSPIWRCSPWLSMRASIITAQVGCSLAVLYLQWICTEHKVYFRVFSLMFRVLARIALGTWYIASAASVALHSRRLKAFILCFKEAYVNWVGLLGTFFFFFTWNVNLFLLNFSLL